MRQDRLTPGVSSPVSLVNSPALTTACFSIQAEADPGVMLRVLELFAKRGLIPSHWHGDLEDEESLVPGLIMELQVTGLTHQQIGHVTESLRGMVSVKSVLTTVQQCG
jgi:acetolactate synthase small subunit